MTYNVFGGTFNLAQSINLLTECLCCIGHVMQGSWQSVTLLWMLVEFTSLTVIAMTIIRGDTSSCDGVYVS